ncbi:hypothetical protein BJF78_24645 [Pseudonocardia sp. CNS-139]|nr:hypothetical protein BJF78_24645 [Pseudonocardia sp. CNS-139]
MVRGASGQFAFVADEDPDEDPDLLRAQWGARSPLRPLRLCDLFAEGLDDLFPGHADSAPAPVGASGVRNSSSQERRMNSRFPRFTALMDPDRMYFKSVR